ncbi:hypothetical protein ACMHZR_005076, partial [Escherichia coli]
MKEAVQNGERYQYSTIAIPYATVLLVQSSPVNTPDNSVNAGVVGHLISLTLTPALNGSTPC